MRFEIPAVATLQSRLIYWGLTSHTLVIGKDIAQLPQLDLAFGRLNTLPVSRMFDRVYAHCDSFLSNAAFS